jgi:sphingosine kinase
MELEIIRTQYAGHAYEVAQSIKPGEYDGLITVSGDGLLHEVINALYTRPDSSELLKAGLTFGVIPGGTSNGLSKALLDSNDEDYTIENAAYLIARGRRGWMDLTEIYSEY